MKLVGIVVVLLFLAGCVTQNKKVTKSGAETKDYISRSDFE